jgi:hypothetical protein
MVGSVMKFFSHIHPRYMEATSAPFMVNEMMHRGCASNTHHCCGEKKKKKKKKKHVALESQRITQMRLKIW